MVEIIGTIIFLVLVICYQEYKREAMAIRLYNLERENGRLEGKR